MPTRARWRQRKLASAKGRKTARARRQSRWRHPCRPRDCRPANGTYGVPVHASDPRLVAFARFVDRALRDARARGRSIDDVEKATGLPRSTIYRWRRQEVLDPQPAQVNRFCDGLDIPRQAAAVILGWAGTPQTTDVDPPMDADIRVILRRLADPHVDEAEKVVIRSTLRYLAQQVRRPADGDGSVAG